MPITPLTKDEMAALHHTVHTERRVKAACEIRIAQALEEIQNRCGHLNAMSMGVWGLFCQDCGRFL